MIGENIKNLRTKEKMTQKELADKLFVTAQAVSRWENGDVEPSVSTVAQMAKIFNVPTDAILGVEMEEQAPADSTVEYVVKEAPQMLALCEKCNTPIYKKEDIVRRTILHGRSPSTTQITCAACEKKRVQNDLKQRCELSKERKKRSFVFGGLAAALLIVIGIVAGIKSTWGNAVPVFVSSVFAFTLVSCLFLENNFIEDLIGDIASWGYVTMPGLIFTLDLDGIIWLITVKLAFWVLGMLLATVATLLAVAVGAVLSILVYPFAITTVIRHPEKAEY